MHEAIMELRDVGCIWLMTKSLVDLVITVWCRELASSIQQENC